MNIMRKEKEIEKTKEYGFLKFRVKD